MSKARDVRSLIALTESASTARVLNLSTRGPTLRRALGPGEVLFRTPALDRAIIVKHRLRPHERDWFVAPKSVSTKLLVPIDPNDLAVGAHALFLNQKGYDEALVGALAIDRCPEDGARDRLVLAALDELPSLDPFLTREHLKRRGFRVSDEYFDISPADVSRMTGFVRREIVPLVKLCFGQNAGPLQTEKLTEKLLAAEIDASMDPLRLTLKMDENQFVEGVFCWKGFLYYKWVLAEVLGEVGSVIRGVRDVQSVGEATSEELARIAGGRIRVQVGVKRTCRAVRASLQTYDEAFDQLTQRADPIAFRDFLLAAPRMFAEVGEKLAAIQHITSFWRYRARGGCLTMPVGDLLDVMTDFENSLCEEPETARAWAA